MPREASWSDDYNALRVAVLSVLWALPLVACCLAMGLRRYDVGKALLCTGLGMIAWFVPEVGLLVSLPILVWGCSAICLSRCGDSATVRDR